VDIRVSQAEPVSTTALVVIAIVGSLLIALAAFAPEFSLPNAESIAGQPWWVWAGM
jgi:hypothetical protein